MESYSPQTWTDGTSIANAARLGHMESGISDAHLNFAGTVALDSFSGADDDAMLSAAMSYASAQSQKPIILMGNRRYIFNNSLGKPYDGFALVGAGRGWLSAGGAPSAVHTSVKLNVSPQSGQPAGYWIHNDSGELWNLYIEGIDFTGNQTTQFIRSPPGNTLWSSTFRNLSMMGFYAMYGNSSEALATDLITIDGISIMLQAQDCCANIRGSDNRGLWADGANVGSGQQPSGGAGGKFLIQFQSCSKTTVGPLYITADNGWRGVLCRGTDSYGSGIVFTGMVVEGRNDGDPCEGNLIRVEGGQPIFRDTNIDMGMVNPHADEHGLIEVNGSAKAVIDGLVVSHQSTVPTTTPVVYADGNSEVYVRNVLRYQRQGGAAWGSQLPVAHQTGTGLIADHDTSVTVTGP